MASPVAGAARVVEYRTRHWSCFARLRGMESKVALVTGASRGVGAATARMLAERGLAVVVNYRDKARRAEGVVRAIRSSGGRAVAVKADMTDAADMEAMFATVGERFGRLDLLVLNASGGLERGEPSDYAMRLNSNAQARSTDLALPLMNGGGRVVFVTSHLAHFYGTKPVYPGYEPVAASKKAGEDALRSRIPELSERDVSLVVVSGDLMERQEPGLIEARRQEAGWLPTVDDFARAIAEAAESDLASGSTVFVGSTEWRIT
jgi:NAD(P)-dependent dehydrogenase (short-subunit alcohol dehydrogenase family)